MSKSIVIGEDGKVIKEFGTPAPVLSDEFIKNHSDKIKGIIKVPAWWLKPIR